MVRADHIDQIVSQVTGVSVEAIHGDRGNDKICDARNLAMLKCKQWLKWGSIKLRKHYGKDSHTTILSDLKSANNLIDTNSEAKDTSLEVDKKIREKIAEIKLKQQLYDLHYRLRGKGIKVKVKYKTISINEKHREKLEKSRTMKLLKLHGYEIQYSIF